MGHLYNNNEPVNKTSTNVYIACSDATWREHYQEQHWKYVRLEHPAQLRGVHYPIVRLHEEDCFSVENYQWVDILPAMAEVGHVHLEYAHVDQTIDGTGEEIILDKFFMSEV